DGRVDERDRGAPAAINAAAALVLGADAVVAGDGRVGQGERVGKSDIDAAAPISPILVPAITIAALDDEPVERGRDCRGGILAVADKEHPANGGSRAVGGWLD